MKFPFGHVVVCAAGLALALAIFAALISAPLWATVVLLCIGWLGGAFIGIEVWMIREDLK